MHLLAQIEAIANRLLKPLPGIAGQQRHASPERLPLMQVPEGVCPRESAVLIALFEFKSELCTLLFRRTPDNSPHSGQISFPGGKQETTDNNLLHTALREAEEEVGIPQDCPKILGKLSPLYIPVSNFRVLPVIAHLEFLPVFKPNPTEVSEILIVPLAQLFDTNNHQLRTVQVKSGKLTVPAIDIHGHTIWGATAIILGEMQALVTEAFTPLNR
jgi:8-oxo-dGTP pyrophosphatase MutT (NUDIX family)